MVSSVFQKGWAARDYSNPLPKYVARRKGGAKGLVTRSYHPPLASPRYRTILELQAPHHAAHLQPPSGSLVELDKGGWAFT